MSSKKYCRVEEALSRIAKYNSMHKINKYVEWENPPLLHFPLFYCAFFKIQNKELNSLPALVRQAIIFATVGKALSPEPFLRQTHMAHC